MRNRSNPDKIPTHYERLERFWMSLISERVPVTSRGWRSDEYGTSDTTMIDLSHVRGGDYLYRNVMEHDQNTPPFFSIYTTVNGVRVQIEVSPDHISDLSLVSVLEDFLHTYNA